MGKLIRKKTTVAKKKKKQDAGVPSDNGNPVSMKPSDQTPGRAKNTVVKRSPQIGAISGKQKDKPKVKISFIENTVQFLREVKVELKKVAWPTRKQTIGSTVVVLVLVFIIASFLGVVDIILASLVKTVL